MNGCIRVLSLTGFVLALGTSRAHAGPDLKKCKDSSRQHANACMQAKNAAEGANTAQAQAVGNAAGTNIKPNAGASKQVNQDAANRLKGAKDQCEKEKEQCEKDCDDAKQSADRKVQQGQAQMPACSQPPCPAAKVDQPQIEPTKQNECIAPIMGIMGPLGQGAQDAQNAANGDGNTGNQAGGMPPIPPISPPSSSPSPPTTPTPAPTADLMSPCTDPASATLAACTKTLVDKCTPGLATNATTDPTCDTFTMRYCNTLPATGTNQFAGTNVPQQGQSRAGAGVGSSYCNTAIAKNFCEDPGRSQCATCQNYRNQFSDACKANPASCAPTQFSSSCPTTEPPIATTPPSGTSPVAGVGGGSTGGGGGDLMADTPTNGDRYSTASVAKEGQSQAAKMDMAVSEGGGGGSGADDYNWKEDDFASKFRKKTDLATAAKGATPGAGSRSPASVDIGRNTGPSLFSISSTTIQNMCARERLHHCGNLN